MNTFAPRTPTFAPGDTVRLTDGTELRVTECCTVKHDLPGGAGITLNDEFRRRNREPGEPDRWFYADQVERILRQGGTA